MKDLLLKSSGTLLIGFLALIFTGCKDQRNTNDDYRETYPPAGGTEQRMDESYDSNDTLNPNDDMDNSQQNNQSGNNQSGNQSGNRQSGSVPDDGTGVNPTTSDNIPANN